MFKIRLLRCGRKKRAFFRIVVTDTKSHYMSANAKVIGHLCPFTKDVSLDKDVLDYYVSRGAKMTKNLFWRLKATMPNIDQSMCD